MSSDDKPTMRPFTRHVLICTGLACNPQGSAEALPSKLGELLGDLSKLSHPCRIKRTTVPCLGICMGGPILAVYPDGVWYHHVDEALLARIVEEHLKGGQPVAEAIFYRTGAPSLAGCQSKGESAELPDETDEALAAQAEDRPQPSLDVATEAEARRREIRRNRTKRGLVLVNTGEGKGKSTAAFGVILRMLGRNKRVALVQFLKHESGQWGEIRALARLGLETVKTGDGWTWTSKDMDETQARALHGWEIAKGVYAHPHTAHCAPSASTSRTVSALR